MSAPSDSDPTPQGKTDDNFWREPAAAADGSRLGAHQ